MATLDVVSHAIICRKCGHAYTSLRKYFYACSGSLYEGSKYLPYCKECVDKMFQDYLDECRSEELAAHQICRKLNLYWNAKAYKESTFRSPTRSFMGTYLSRINSAPTEGKTYDDTLREWGLLFHIPRGKLPSRTAGEGRPKKQNGLDISDEILEFWGPGYTEQMYQQLEQRRRYWMSRLGASVDVDAGTEALIRQICALEIDINRDRAAGVSVDKNVNTLNTLLGSAMLKPSQRNDTVTDKEANTPFGVWIQRWETKRPIPDSDPELKNENRLVRYIETWFGHLAKMLGLKNAYSKLYEDKIAQMRLDRPELEELDDESFFDEVIGNDDDTEQD